MAVRSPQFLIVLLFSFRQKRRCRCLMILSVRAMSPRAAWAATTSAALPFVTRIIVLRHSNWKDNYR